MSDQIYTPVRTFRLAVTPEKAAFVLALLDAEGFRYEQEPFAQCAYRLVEEPAPLGHSLAATFGLIYIQAKSSMLPPLLLAPEQGATALDMCASPGGKTSLLGLLVGPHGFVLGNEPSRTRLETLRRNLARMNALNVATASHFGQEIPLGRESWPYILLDPPCSGWGTLDKHPDAITKWTGEKLKPLVDLQRQLLDHAASLLEPGGVLMYSTCTTNPQENEAQAAYAIEHLGLELDSIAPPEGFTADPTSLPGTEGVFRVDGEASGSQGFFLARLIKPGAVKNAAGASVQLRGDQPTRKQLEAVRASGVDVALLPPGELLCFRDRLFFIHDTAFDLTTDSLKWQGVPLGKFVKGKFRPNPKLHAVVARKTDLPVLDLESVDELKGLLSGQSLPAPGKGGLGVLAFRGTPLGRVAIKGPRAIWMQR